MRTGEGKTKVAALALYLNALTGEGAHIVTVNDYLSRIGAVLMGQVYNFLGLKTGVINSKTFLIYMIRRRKKRTKNGIKSENLKLSMIF